jgi:hypothetical protein
MAAMLAPRIVPIVRQINELKLLKKNKENLVWQIDSTVLSS